MNTISGKFSTTALNNNSSITIHQARVVDPSQSLDQVIDIHIQTGKIIGLGEPPASFQADTTISAQGFIACPGLVDLEHFIREPGFEQKGTLESELRAAVSNGVTAICASPTTRPVIDSPALVNWITERQTQLNLCRIHPIGALTTDLKGEQLSELYSLKQAGCLAVTNGLYPFASNRILRNALNYAKTHDLTVFFSPLDYSLREGAFIHEGPLSAQTGLTGIPTTAETIALARDLLLVEEIGITAHFSRLTSAPAVEMIARAKEKGLPVSADVTIHHLLLSEQDMVPFDTQYHIMPPLRTKTDQTALINGLNEGIIDAISSSHEPHQSSAKLVPFAESAPGISTMDHYLGLTYQLVEQGKSSLIDWVKFLSCNPSRILGQAYGSLRVGAVADICIFDPHSSAKVDSQRFLSMGKNTPYQGKLLKGIVKFTLVDGQLVFRSDN